MTQATQKELIEQCITQCQKTDSLYESMNKSMGVDINGPLFNHLFKQHTLLIKLTSQLLGDKLEWLDWFINANDYGKKGLSAKIFERGKEGREVKITCVDELIEIMNKQVIWN